MGVGNGPILKCVCQAESGPKKFSENVQVLYLGMLGIYVFHMKTSSVEHSFLMEKLLVRPEILIYRTLMTYSKN